MEGQEFPIPPEATRDVFTCKVTELGTVYGQKLIRSPEKALSEPQAPSLALVSDQDHPNHQNSSKQNGCKDKVRPTFPEASHELR